MKVFKLIPDYDRHQDMEMVNANEYSIASQLISANDFAPVREQWLQYLIEVSPDSREAWPTDFTKIQCDSSLPVFSRRAVDALRDLLEDSGEILPLRSSDGEFFVFHPLRVLDALDLERCQWQDDDFLRLDYLARYEFLPERIGKVTIFKLLELLDDGRRLTRTGLFVTDRFVRRVEEAGLAGFKFELLWPPDAVEAAKVAEAERKRTRRKKPAKSQPRKSGALTAAELGAIPWPPGKRPEPFPFLRHIWVTVINPRMDGDWIGDVLTAAGHTPNDGLMALCADSLQRLLQTGADREDFCFLARSFVAEGVWWAFKMLDYPGVMSHDYTPLADKLLEAAPRGQDGRLGGWPTRTRRRSVEPKSPCKPTAFLRQIWQDAINDRMSGQWIEDVIQAADAAPDQALTVTCADALQRLLDQGVDRTDLSHLARHQVAEGIRAAFRLLSDPGVQEDDFDELANELLNAGPRGQDGLPGGWPLNKIQIRA